MATSTNYGWTEPDNTDLVTNGALAIRTLGNAIDTSLWNSGYGQAGKNKIINGGMQIWQRGTTGFTTDNTYTADRWRQSFSGGAASVSQQTFPTGQTDVPNNPTYFLRYAVTTGDNSLRLEQPNEDVRMFAGQTITISFYAKGTNPSLGSVDIYFRQEFGGGGSAAVATLAGSIVLTASWQRFTKTITVPSISGKTIGTNSNFLLDIRQPIADTGTAAWTLDLSNVQMEYGSTATPFQTASGGSIQGELAMCQRYYYRTTASGLFSYFSGGNNYSTTTNYSILNLPVTLRTAPASIETTGTAANYRLAGGGVATSCSVVPAIDQTGTNQISIVSTVASGLTVGYAASLGANNTTSAYIGVSAEL